MRLSVGAKLAIGFTVITLLMGVNLWVGLKGLGEVVNTYQGEVARIIEARSQTQEIERLASRQVQAIMGYLITLDDRYRQEFVNASLTGSQILGAFKENATEDEAVALIDKVSEAKTAFERLASPLMDRILSQQQLRMLLAGDLGARQNELFAATRALFEYQDAQVSIVQEKAASVSSWARTAMLIIAMAAVGAAVGAGILITRGLSRPVKEAARAALRLAQGDLTVQQVAVRSRDEIGDLAGAFNRMVINLRSMIAEIQHTSRSLMSNSQMLLAAADQSTSANRTNLERGPARRRRDQQSSRPGAGDSRLDGATPPDDRSDRRELARSGAARSAFDAGPGSHGGGDQGSLGLCRAGRRGRPSRHRAGERGRERCLARG